MDYGSALAAMCFILLACLGLFTIIFAFSGFDDDAVAPVLIVTLAMTVFLGALIITAFPVAPLHGHYHHIAVKVRR